VNLFSDFIRVLCHLAAGILLQFKDELDVVVLVARGDVKVKMEYRLSGNFSIVGENIEPVKVQAVRERLGDDVDCVHHAMERIGRERQKILAMPFGDNKGVAVVNRLNIENADSVVVFVEDFRRQFSRDNIAEYTIVHGMLVASEQREENLPKNTPKVKTI
jgi:hypothetical protein